MGQSFRFAIRKQWQVWVNSSFRSIMQKFIFNSISVENNPKFFAYVMRSGPLLWHSKATKVRQWEFIEELANSAERVGWMPIRRKHFNHRTSYRWCVQKKRHKRGIFYSTTTVMRPFAQNAIWLYVSSLNFRDSSGIILDLIKISL